MSVEQQSQHPEKKPKFPLAKRVGLLVSSLLLGLAGAASPLLSRSASAQELPPIAPTTPEDTAKPVKETVPDASFPPDVNLPLLTERKSLPKAYLEQLRAAVDTAIQEAKKAPSITPDEPKPILLFETKNSSGETINTWLPQVVLDDLSPAEMNTLKATLEYFATIFMVKANTIPESLGPQAYEAELLQRLEAENVAHFPPDLLVKLALFTASSTRKAEVLASKYQGESSPNPAFIGEKSQARLQEDAHLYPARIILAYLGDFLAGKQPPLTNQEALLSSEQKNSVFALLLFILVDISPEELAKRVGETQGESTFLSKEHLARLTDGLHGLANSSLFPKDIYDASQVMQQASLPQKWRLMELKKAGEVERYWQEVMRQQVGFFLANLAKN